MHLAGSALRLLVTIVQIGALLAFALSAPAAQAHRGQAHRGHECAGHHGRGAVAVGQAPAGADAAIVAEVDAGVRKGSAASCCAHSCCHVVAAEPAGPVQPLRWAHPAGFVAAPSLAHAGVTPETLPEPPRTH